VLVFCGLGLPVPEDIVLIASGFLGAEEGTSLFKLIAVMYVGILIGDSIIYTLGRNFGRRVLGTRMGRWVITEDRLVKAEALFERYGTGVVFVGRFLPGLRAPVFFSAGLLRFSWPRFLIMDGFAAFVSAPLFVWLGHWAWSRYAEDLDLLDKTIGRTKMIMGLSALMIAAIIFYWIRYRSRVKSASS
jgi:membrane protein DedA with SNARE-associated domain